MQKRHLRSDLSVEEARFFTTGRMIVGTGNVLTGLIKYVGMYTELAMCNRTAEIASYNPDTDVFFKHENMGYTTIRKEIAKSEFPISRRYIKALSRKWPASAVLISFDAVHIISELFAYISREDELKAACVAYLKKYDLSTEWDKIIPIQYEFLGVRIQDHHENWQIAKEIVYKLSTITLEGHSEIS